MTEQIKIQDGYQTCPKCETSILAGEAYCSGCGYEFSTNNESIGPFSFAFPVVESAYIPSGIGTQKGTLLMVIYSLGAAVVIGPLIYLTHILAAEMAAGLIRMGICLSGLLGMLVYFLGYILAAPIAGLLVGAAIGKGAIHGKSRNSATAKRIGIIMGMVCFASFIATYISALGMKEGFDSWIDYLKLSWNVIAIPVAAYYAADESIKGTPFCEECQQFMKKAELKKRSIRYEKQLMDVLDTNELNKISTFPPDEGTKNYCKVTFWSCGCERGGGFIHMHTTQMRISKDNSGKVNENTQTRLVFSRKVAKTNIKELQLLANT